MPIYYWVFIWGLFILVYRLIFKNFLIMANIFNYDSLILLLKPGKVNYLLLGCIPQSQNICNCPASRLKKEPGVSDRDITNLLDRESYKSEAKTQEWHPTLYGGWQTGLHSILCYSREEETTGYKGNDGQEDFLGTRGTVGGTHRQQLFRLATVLNTDISCW